jgi:D-alanyl-D-alanine carboxypeptidase
LPADGQITSARDMAILARAIIRDLPEYEYFVHIPSIRFGRRVTQNFNKLIGRYPGADGFKTGFICASGYNLIGSATRNGKRLIAVVMGASSGMMRAVRAVQLLDRGFGGNNLSWLQPSLGNVENLVPVDASPPDLHEQMCGPHRKRPASDEDEDTVANNAGASGTGESGVTFYAAGLQAPMPKPSELLAGPAAASEPIPVYTGPTRTGAALIAAIAADTSTQTSRPHGKQSHHAVKKPDAVAEAKDAGKDNGKDTAKNADAKPVRHANAKPAAKSTDQAAAKPAKPKTAAKPGAKPAPKNTDG